MKAILVTDMPEKCFNCQLMTDDMYCKGFTPYTKENVAITKMCVEDYVTLGTKHPNCPLKPMPRKNYKKFYFGNIDENRFVYGWNACIDEILGEE